MTTTLSAAFEEEVVAAQKMQQEHHVEEFVTQMEDPRSDDLTPNTTVDLPVFL